MRWPTNIENVLTIKKAPTNSETNENASKMLLKNPKPSVISCVASSAASSPVCTCTPGPTTAFTWVASSSCDTFSAAATSMEV